VNKPKQVPVVASGVLQQKIFGLPVDRKAIFSNHKDLYKKSIEKRQRKLIIKSTFLKPFMRADEKIYLITTGYSPTTLMEKLLVGWIFIYLKRSLLIFTNRRIIHVPTTPIYRYRNVITEIAYASCSSIQIKGRAMLVKYKKKGVVERFFGISGKEIKKIREILKRVTQQGGVAPEARRVNICPQCGANLATKINSCETCALKFKSKGLAATLAILFPGGGYFYARQIVLGLLAAVVEIILVVFAGISINDVMSGFQTGYVSYLLPIAAVLFLIFEKTMAAIHAAVLVAECIPTKRQVTFSKPTGAPA
jgi:hypothetical protein